MRRVASRAESGEVVRELAHDSSVRAIAWSPDGALLASGGNDKKVVVRRGWGVRLAPAPSEANSSQVSTPPTLSVARMEAIMTPALAQATALLSAETAARQDAESGMARSRDELAQSRDELAQARDQLAQLRDQLAQARGEAQALRALPLEQLEALAGQLIEARWLYWQKKRAPGEVMTWRTLSPASRSFPPSHSMLCTHCNAREHQPC